MHCTAHPDCLPTDEPCTQTHKNKQIKRHNIITVPFICSYPTLYLLYYASLFAIQITGSKSSWLRSQLHTFFCQFTEINYAYRATEINESLGMRGIKKKKQYQITLQIMQFSINNMHILVPPYTILFVLWIESYILRIEASTITLTVLDTS